MRHDVGKPQKRALDIEKKPQDGSPGPINGVNLRKRPRPFGTAVCNSQEPSVPQQNIQTGSHICLPCVVLIHSSAVLTWAQPVRKTTNRESLSHRSPKNSTLPICSMVFITGAKPSGSKLSNLSNEGTLKLIAEFCCSPKLRECNPRTSDKCLASEEKVSLTMLQHLYRCLKTGQQKLHIVAGSHKGQQTNTAPEIQNTQQQESNASASPDIGKHGP